MTKTLILLTVVAACGKGSGSGSSKTASLEVFGKSPVPPGELAKVKAGMTQAEVKAAFPSAKPTPNHSGSPSLSIESGYSNIEYRIGFYSDIDAVASISVRVPKDLGSQLEKAWGPAKQGHFGPEWSNDDGGYEVSTMEMGRTTDVEFRPFTPLTAEFFGSKPAPVDALAKIHLGMTRDEVTKTVPGLEGAPKGGGSYTPFKAKPRDVTLDVGFDENDKVERMAVRMPGKAVALLEKAWGPPKVGKNRGLGDECRVWDTADKALRISINAGEDPMDVTYQAPDRGTCEVP